MSLYASGAAAANTMIATHDANTMIAKIATNGYNKSIEENTMQ
jgi:hypothetical protein